MTAYDTYAWLILLAYLWGPLIMINTWIRRSVYVMVMGSVMASLFFTVMAFPDTVNAVMMLGAVIATINYVFPGPAVTPSPTEEPSPPRTTTPPPAVDPRQRDTEPPVTEQPPLPGTADTDDIPEPRHNHQIWPPEEAFHD